MGSVPLQDSMKTINPLQLLYPVNRWIWHQKRWLSIGICPPIQRYFTALLGEDGIGLLLCCNSG